MHHFSDQRRLAVVALIAGPLISAQAQVITAAELLPPIGPDFHTYAVLDLFPWDSLSGTGVLWDYAWIEVDSSMDNTFSAIDVNSAPSAAQYPDADRVLRSISNGGTYVIDRFLDDNGGAVHELGSVGPVLSYVYVQPELTYVHPMTIGDVATDDYCYWSDGLGIQYNFCGETRVTFDAMGTLVLPYGSFSDVKHITHWSSSFENTQPSADSSYIIRQQWFLPGTPWPVLDVVLYIAEDGTFYPSGRLIDASTLTTIAERPEQPTWTLHPNPAETTLTIGCLPATAQGIEIIGMDGRVAHRHMTTGPTVNLDLSLIPAGAYVVKVYTANGASARKLIKR